MRKIALINASPKRKESASKTIVNVLHKMLKKANSPDVQISEYTIHTGASAKRSYFVCFVISA